MFSFSRNGVSGRRRRRRRNRRLIFDARSSQSRVFRTPKDARSLTYISIGRGESRKKKGCVRISSNIFTLNWEDIYIGNVISLYPGRSNVVDEHVVFLGYQRRVCVCVFEDDCSVVRWDFLLVPVVLDSFGDSSSRILWEKRSHSRWRCLAMTCSASISPRWWYYLRFDQCIWL